MSETRSGGSALPYPTKNDLTEATRVHGAVDEYADLIAERIVQLGGVAEGTVGVVAERSALVDYPLMLAKGAEHVAALSDALAMFGRTPRMGIEEMSDLEDADSADILSEISRGVDKWLWFVEARQQGG
jgi:starvation-inducible DNA-binding protein